MIAPRRVAANCGQTGFKRWENEEGQDGRRLRSGRYGDCRAIVGAAVSVEVTELEPGARVIAEAEVDLVAGGAEGAGAVGVRDPLVAGVRVVTQEVRATVAVEVADVQLAARVGAEAAEAGPQAPAEARQLSADPLTVTSGLVQGKLTALSPISRWFDAGPAPATQVAMALRMWPAYVERVALVTPLPCSALQKSRC